MSEKPFEMCLYVMIVTEISSKKVQKTLSRIFRSAVKFTKNIKRQVFFLEIITHLHFLSYKVISIVIGCCLVVDTVQLVRFIVASFDRYLMLVCTC